MDKKDIQNILNCNNYMECMKMIYNNNHKSYKENELPKKVQNHLKEVRNRSMDINKPIQIRKTR